MSPLKRTDDGQLVLTMGGAAWLTAIVMLGSILFQSSTAWMHNRDVIDAQTLAIHQESLERARGDSLIMLTIQSTLGPLSADVRDIKAYLRKCRPAQPLCP